MADISGEQDGRRRSLGPLRRLYPYIIRYRKLVIGAVISLVIAAATTVALPLAVRRMIDHGFNASGTVFIAEYFAALVAMAAILAAACHRAARAAPTTGKNPTRFLSSRKGHRD